ncbi:hypothetical protein N7471_010538 [Penicillium samsonianum]|uniref:uncharacterized protein n=1 Tax=Penicillium samsonianum TaxID=1882272 RepID=UPI00254895EF|nr:uncharacterized protein N7471_010538 [Penicillium samsonianum]KAJ6126045.1 hypothetical protein N7471_010538 [Penicillium samsonianum]
MESKGIKDFDDFTKNAPERKARPSKNVKYYAVAGGESTGVFTHWDEAEKASKGTIACHERFNTKKEAEDFIESWKDAYADVWRREIRQSLDNGWRPRDMKLNIGSILCKEDGNNVTEDRNKAPKNKVIDSGELPKVGLLAIKEENSQTGGRPNSDSDADELSADSDSPISGNYLQNSTGTLEEVKEFMVSTNVSPGLHQGFQECTEVKRRVSRNGLSEKIEESLAIHENCNPSDLKTAQR